MAWMRVAGQSVFYFLGHALFLFFCFLVLSLTHTLSFSVLTDLWKLIQ